MTLIVGYLFQRAILHHFFGPCQSPDPSGVNAMVDLRAGPGIDKLLYSGAIGRLEK